MNSTTIPKTPTQSSFQKKTEKMQKLGQSSKSTINNNPKPPTYYFPNYYILDNLKISHKQKMILYVMLKQQTCSKIMVSQFCKLARKQFVGSEWQIKDFQKEFQSKGRSMQDCDILKWYTKESFFYRLLNKLLRAGKDSTELFYSQYIVKLLHKAILAVYKKQKLSKNQFPSNFTCYRGAYFSKKQIEQLQLSVGKHIETLGFLSASLQRQTAFGFITNAFVEIQVSDVPKDEELDLGYAFLTEEFSQKPYEKEVLFNVLSSFQVKSVQRVENIWYIKLEYGVTYQLMKQHKERKEHKEHTEDKLNSQSEQLILAILSWQVLFKNVYKQEQCLVEQGAVEEYISMIKKKIELCNSIPEFLPLGLGQEMMLYIDLTVNWRFKDRETKWREQIRQKYAVYEKQVQNNPIDIKKTPIHLKFLAILILQHLCNRNLQQAKQKIVLWKQIKQQLYSEPDFKLYATNNNPSVIGQIQQSQAQIQLQQVITNMRLFDLTLDRSKLAQSLKSAQVLLQKLKTTNGRHNKQYGMLKQIYLDYCHHIGFMGYQKYLQEVQYRIIFRRSCGYLQDFDDSLVKLIPVWKEAYKFIQKGSWTEAIKVCSEFRNKNYQARQHLDLECFGPITYHLNKNTTQLGQKRSIVQACLSVQHPQSSRFYQQVIKRREQLKPSQGMVENKQK